MLIFGAYYVDFRIYVRCAYIRGLGISYCKTMLQRGCEENS